MNLSRPKTHATHRRAYTLIEVLFAVGIFAIGFAMVATIFPSALLLQKRTVDTVNAHQVARNAQATIKGLSINRADLLAAMPVIPPATWDTDGAVLEYPDVLLTPPMVGNVAKWTLPARSFPAKEANPTRRSFYWVPVIQDTNTAPGIYDFRLFLFIMQRHINTDYAKPGAVTWANPSSDPLRIPGVRQVENVVPTMSPDAPPLTRISFANQDFDTATAGNDTGVSSDLLVVPPGTQVLDNTGTVHDVIRADTTWIEVPYVPNFTAINAIWIGHPGTQANTNEPGNRQPVVMILPMIDVVQP